MCHQCHDRSCQTVRLPAATRKDSVLLKGMHRARQMTQVHESTCLLIVHLRTRRNAQSNKTHVPPHFLLVSAVSTFFFCLFRGAIGEKLSHECLLLFGSKHSLLVNEPISSLHCGHAQFALTHTVAWSVLTIWQSPVA